jgi:DNA mismatch repair protein MutL
VPRMKKIQLLPPEISQKIAAGEVIERPFSVVKELVENSLDAGASEIKVELQAGGKKFIRVQDNGAGMSREDAQLCFDRHATSKIASEQDLDKISTLGFRGEALASISAVSELALKTSDGEGEMGTGIERKGGELISLQDIAFPQGTSVEVKDLFYNLPARQKFLRSDQSELNVIVRYLSSVALAYPEVRFSLVQSRREILNCPQVSSYKERIFQLYGKAILERLMEIDFGEGESRIFGYGSRPPSGKRDKTQQLFFVNRRLVKDRILQAALNQAYRGFLEKDLFPEAFLFLTLPYAEVDVNVHPAKAEVRFRDGQFIFYLVLRGAEKAMLKDTGIKTIYPAQESAGPASRVEDLAAARAWLKAERPEAAGEILFPSAAAPKEGQAYPRVLGQYLNTYIVAVGEEGLFIIDQHNAHERVLFEKYKEIDAQKRWPQKIPLIPLLVDLPPSLVLSLEKNQPLLEQAGFRAEAMGGRTYALNGYPDIFEPEAAKETFLALLEEMGEEEVERRREKLLATLACKTAIKAREPLPQEKMNYLVEELFKTSAPSLCPHGRPVVIKVEKSQIEKGLKRMS